MGAYVHDLREIDTSHHMAVGGKAANLGELAKIDGIDVPEGFCVSTAAFERILAEVPAIHAALDRLALLKPGDRAAIAALSAEIRSMIEGVAIPAAISDEIAEALARHGAQHAYAVRSSATAEDLPTASFAGQQDSYLNIIGAQAILQHISRCWASLFAERAVTYRIQKGFDHRQVALAVVVQRMVYPQVSGIMFTADPITSNRTIVAIDASFGLGEALVAGLVSADSYRVRDGHIIAKQIGAKQLAIYADEGGGTQQQQLAPEQQRRQALTDAQIVQLARLGRAIEAHFGQPQDIEWCLADGGFAIVQSRPITTLFPIPEAGDQGRHVYLSVGHQQMMTAAMKPLGLSFFQLTSARPMFTAGGRLFVDVIDDLISPAKRTILVDVLGKSDPLIRGALLTLIERGDLPPAAPDAGQAAAGAPPMNVHARLEHDPSIVAELIASGRRSIEVLRQAIQAHSGPELCDFIVADIQELRKAFTDPRSFGAIMTAMQATTWLNETLGAWLGEQGLAATLSQSAPNNITSEMGLALLDVADALRPYPEVIAYLQQVTDDGFLDELPGIPGGQAARDALTAYLATYGMRCAGEIDITRPRWSEKPTALLPIILSNLRNFEPGASRRRFEQGQREAQEKEQQILDRLRQLPDGQHKAEEAKRMIDLLRTFIGYREYPKYTIVSRYFIYKQALLREAAQLVQAGALREPEDIYYLTFDELREAIRTKQIDGEIIGMRKAEYARYERLTPPRVMTSEGEIIASAYQRENLPAGAIVGLPVSAGVVEGRARVIFRMEDANIEAGDILVTPFTDPSWTPLFVAIQGLVTEVGGLMTHGAVIAREYGLPAIVGVENATTLIKDGQRIRVHGTAGYIEIL